MDVRSTLAICAAKIVSAICKLFGRYGTALAGLVVLSIDPKIIEKLSAQVRKKIFVVCGTNGKTTANNMLCHALEEEGYKLVCNNEGSNMLRGIAMSFVQASNLRGVLDADYACLEVDEATIPYVFARLRPDYMVLTNVFRDQLDRYGAIDHVTKLLENAMKKVPGMTIIVNGDDVLSASLAAGSKNPYYTYGISQQVFQSLEEDEVHDGQICKKCGAKLEYEFFHMSQLGKYFCPECGFKRPDIDFDASSIDLAEGLSFDVDDHHISVKYEGFYNIYNILAVYAAVRAAGIEISGLEKAFESYHMQHGRLETFNIQGTKVTLNLVKNPASFNQGIRMLLKDSKEKDVIFIVNDHEADGFDISWLWDINFELLADAKICSVQVSGMRKKELLLCMKYMDVPATAADHVKQAVKNCKGHGNREIYVFVNYTALIPTRNALIQMQK